MRERSRRPDSRWMALDIGHKTIGVALSDPLKLTARPLLTLRRRDLDTDVAAVLRLATEHKVEKCIIGRPSHMDGRPSEILAAIQPMAERLAPSLRVEWYDERLSTRAAEETMGQLGLPISERRQRRNEFAAAIILKWYLDETRTS